MFDLLATLLAWFYELWPSYGMAIVFLTLVVMIILTPLTLKGTRSMMMMQALQPEVRKLQQQYKDDRQKLNEEMLRFYRENKINPIGGCVPLLIQLPVFIVLYQVLAGLTRVGDDGTFDPKYLDHDSALYRALDGSKSMVSWGLDLSRSATEAIRDSFGTAVPYLVLIIAVTVTSYIQQKQVAGRNPNAPVNPQQQMLMRILPAFFAFISIGFPAALVVYFLVSNLYRVAQQQLISHTIYKPAHASGIFDTKARDADDDEPAAKQLPAKPAASKAASSAPVVERKGFLDRLLGGAETRDRQQRRVGEDPRRERQGLPRPPGSLEEHHGEARRPYDDAGNARRGPQEAQEEEVTPPWSGSRQRVERSMKRSKWRSTNSESTRTKQSTRSWKRLAAGLFGRLRGQARVRARVRPTRPRRQDRTPRSAAAPPRW